MTNCNHKRGPSVVMSTCSCEAALFLFLLKRAHVDWNCGQYFAGKISKNILFCKNAVALAYYGS